mmetsp:Transcript_10120/g.33186  ORF Transcript_10120/g.33186 Transcript_10120/m.33186 type:complete len:434 (-) Transcript_10120:312-1613(-)
MRRERLGRFVGAARGGVGALGARREPDGEGLLRARRRLAHVRMLVLLRLVELGPELGHERGEIARVEHESADVAARHRRLLFELHEAVLEPAHDDGEDDGERRSVDGVAERRLHQLVEARIGALRGFVQRVHDEVHHPLHLRVFNHVAHREERRLRHLRHLGVRVLQALEHDRKCRWHVPVELARSGLRNVAEICERAHLDEVRFVLHPLEVDWNEEPFALGREHGVQLRESFFGRRFGARGPSPDALEDARRKAERVRLERAPDELAEATKRRASAFPLRHLLLVLHRRLELRQHRRHLVRAERRSGAREERRRPDVAAQRQRERERRNEARLLILREAAQLRRDCHDRVARGAAHLRAPVGRSGGEGRPRLTRHERRHKLLLRLAAQSGEPLLGRSLLSSRALHAAARHRRPELLARLGRRPVRRRGTVRL